MFFPAADGEEFVSVLTELLFELHVAATPDKLNKVRRTCTVCKNIYQLFLVLISVSTKSLIEPTESW